MEILYALLYIVGAVIVVLFVLWVLGIILAAFSPPVVIPNNIRMLIGVFLLIILLIIIFNQFSLSSFGLRHR